MTTLPPVAGASASSPPLIGAAKGNAPEPGFRAAFDNAAANSHHLSTPDQPGKSDKSRKSADKEKDAASAKQREPAPGQHTLLNLLVAPPAPALTEPLSSSLSAQGSGPELKQGSEDMPQIAGSVDSGSAVGLPETTPGIISASAPAPLVDSAANGVDSKNAGKTLESAPPSFAAKTTQNKSPAILQPTRAEVQTQAQPLAGQPVNARAAAQMVDGSSAQLAPASQIFADTSLTSTQPKAADPALFSATAQALPRAAAPPVPVNAGAGKPAKPGNPDLDSVIGLQKAELPATAQFGTGGIAQENGDKANAQSDSSPTKKDRVGDPAPAGTPPVQVFAAIDSGAMPSVAAGAASAAPILHQAPSGPALAGASTVPQTTALHLPEPNPSTVALPQINTARVLGSMQGTELRVGMHSQEFGSLSIATSVSPGGVAAQIVLDHGGLSRALAVHLPGIEEKLGHTLGVQARVEVLGTGIGAGQSGQSGSAPREGSRQDRGFSSVPAVSAREPYLAQIPPPEAGEQVVGGLRLSVRA